MFVSSKFILICLTIFTLDKFRDAIYGQKKREFFVALYNESTNINDFNLFSDFENFPSFLTTDENGRVGNILCAYSSLMYYQLKYGFHGVLQNHQLQKIYGIFKKEHLKIIPTNFLTPSFLSIKWENVAVRNESAAGNNHMPVYYFMQNIDAYKTNRFLHLGRTAHFVWLFKEYLPELRTQFTFHNRLIEHVKNFKKQIQNEIPENVVFVGVHYRGTDFVNYLKKRSGSSPVDHHFYDKAFDIYRKRYNNLKQKVIFLAVSDDPRWLKENLGKHQDVVFGEDYRKENVDKSDYVGFDLCTLASSDHSIYAYGTFGLWGSLLAGGDVIVSKSRTTNEKGWKEDNFHKNNAMQDWLFIDTLDPRNISIQKLDNNTKEFFVTDPYYLYK